MGTEPDDPTDTVVVGRIGRPHGVRGEVTVEVRTDDPDLRFTPGAVLRTEPADRGPLTIAGHRWHREVLLLAIEGVESREAAEELRNTELHVPVADLPALEDPDVYYDHQLVGLTVRLPDGTELGTVGAVRHEGADLLVVRRVEGGELLVPFVTAIVPTVDVPGGVVVVDPPEGLLDL
ncbi:ribosome maturation factor RimM [Geodermatophilus poikilotrophus]|uniref:Ribosome maturation factor RimM n=1 Tax=Geodermatophilus poikilotrophus TaxID=1333667 RepID=A0A1I0G5M0_9ACTN|nr:ribosome maturation factor RimM [Geodermatophilus poikilotrophus]SET65227.1 16S rRNA processing protein RimM [Geodermatophilus poikilotrophus]